LRPATLLQLDTVEGLQLCKCANKSKLNAQAGV